MSEETTNKQEMPEQLSDILLVLDKEKMKIQAVKSIDENGKMETVDPTKKNQNQFMRVDKSGDFFSNFFSNFFSQLKNPTNFSFFKVPAPIAVEKAQEMQKQVDKPTPEGEKIMKEHEVKIEQQSDKKQVNQNNMATTQTTQEASEYRYKPEQIDWDTMTNLGLSKEYLEKRNLLEPLLKGYKTNELLWSCYFCCHIKLCSVDYVSISNNIPEDRNRFINDCIGYSVFGKKRSETAVQY